MWNSQSRIFSIKCDPQISRRDSSHARQKPHPHRKNRKSYLPVLRSKRAITVNIEIMRAFVKLRRMLASNKELSRRLDELESNYDMSAEEKLWTDAGGAQAHQLESMYLTSLLGRHQPEATHCVLHLTIAQCYRECHQIYSPALAHSREPRFR
jgi:hypothetical protein